MKMGNEISISGKPYSKAKIKIVLSLKSQNTYQFYWTSIMNLKKPKGLILRVGMSIDLISSMENLFEDWDEYDAILITEWDHEFSPDSLQKLWEDKKPVIGGLYRSRHAKDFPYLIAKENPYKYLTGFPAKELFTVDSTGTGFMLLRKEAIAKLKKPFFGFYKDGMDRFVCNRIREAGMNIWIDPKVRIGHYISQVMY